MKIKRLLSLVLATVAAAGMFALSACGNNSVAGKTYTFYGVEVDSSQYEGTGDTPPTEEDIAALEESYSICYFSFGEDDMLTAIVPYYGYTNTQVYTLYYKETYEGGKGIIELYFSVYDRYTDEYSMGSYYVGLSKTDGMICYEVIYDMYTYEETETVNDIEVIVQKTRKYMCSVYFAAE